MESVCIVCLDDTDLLPIGEFQKLYELLAGTNKFMDQKQYTCLVCHDFFSKIQIFQKKIQSSQDFLLAQVNNYNELKDNDAVPKVKQEETAEFDSDTDFTEEPFTNEEIKILTSKTEDIIDKFEIDKSFQTEDKFEINESIETEDLIDKSEIDESVNLVNDNKPHNSNLLIGNVNVENEPKPAKLKYYHFKRKKMSDDDIDAFIKKHYLPYDIQYVRKLINYRNIKYKVVFGQELYENKFDTVVETQVCADDNEINELMKQSRQQQHFSTRKYKCTKCVLLFNSKKLLRMHVEENHAKTIGPYECDFCGTRMVNKELMETHRQTHFNKYVCKLCQHVECSKQWMFKHFQSKKKLYQCLKCPLIFGELIKLHQHYKSVHLHFICDYCQKTFKDRLWFEKHILFTHTPSYCQQCSKPYPNRSKLLKHMRSSHAADEESERTYCVECDRRFRSWTRYKQHVYTQHGPARRTRYPCNKCDATFFSNSYLKSHINHVHFKKSVQCDKCSKCFVDKFHVQSHIKAVHEKVRSPKNKICTHCGRGFTTTRILRHHVRTHTGERPHKCAHCDAAFAQKAALSTHVKVKHKAK